MSWANDVIDDLIEALREHGTIKENFRDTSIQKGLIDELPENLARSELPAIYVEYSGSSEQELDEDNLSMIFKIGRFALHVLIEADTEEKRVEVLADRVEDVINAIYDHEEDTGGLVNDRYNVTSVDTTEHMLHPFGAARIDLEAHTFCERANRKGD
jgi:hypothetical protein